MYNFNDPDEQAKAAHQHHRASLFESFTRSAAHICVAAAALVVGCSALVGAIKL